MRSRNQKPPSESAKLKLRQYRFKRDKNTVAKQPELKQYTQAEIKKLFKNWR